jgi:hypothetical protein
MAYHGSQQQGREEGENHEFFLPRHERAQVGISFRPIRWRQRFLRFPENGV